MNFGHRRSSQSGHQAAASTPQTGFLQENQWGAPTSITAELNFPTNWSQAPPMDTRRQNFDASSSATQHLTRLPTQFATQLSPQTYPSLPMAVVLPRVLPSQSLPQASETADTHSNSKEKKYGCQLCTKRFDRPSTLKKHLLVHTGEKAWACEICGRRFGVSSNLNRHVRRCKEKWTEGTRTPGSSTPLPELLSPTSARDQLAVSSPTATSMRTPRAYKRKSSSDPTLDAPFPSPKRRRSPAPISWVPDSLRGFDHSQKFKAASTPLPPVTPSIHEERNSYDKSADETPYQSSNWQGRLVGPCYTMSWGACEKVLVF